MAAAKFFLMCLVLHFLKASECTIIITDLRLNRTVEAFSNQPAEFGPELSYSGLGGLVVSASPQIACSDIEPPPEVPMSTPPEYARFYALILRGNCSFEKKVLYAQRAGFSGAIIMNVGSDEIRRMQMDPTVTQNVTIPSAFIGETDGTELSYLFKDYLIYSITITGELPFDIQAYLLPFAITVAICFFGMLTCMVVKCIRDYRHSLRHRLSWAALRRLPLHKFKEGDPYEVCAICLDDYLEGEKLRVLPCNHAYHSKCIDPWLTKRRRVCPVCKAKVRTGSETRENDSELSDSDGERTTSERAPLLQQATQVSAGTFANNRENPFQRASRVQGNRRRGSQHYSHLAEEEGAGAVEGATSDSSLSDFQDNHNTSYGVIDSSRTTPPGASTSAQAVDDSPPSDELTVVTVTRPVKKKKKKKDRSTREGRRSSSPREGNEVTVVQIDNLEADDVTGNATA